MRLHQGYPRLPVPAILRVLRRCAARRCALVSFAALRAALILRAPLLIRLRFATDPSGRRPRYHPLRFARIIRCAPRRAARDARTASRMPGPARWLEIADKARHPAPERLRRLDHARTGRDRPERAKRQPEARNAPSASQKPAPRQAPARSPHRARAGPLARVVARAPTGVPARDSVTRQTPPRTRQAPARSPHRARRRPERARSRPEARTARAPSAGACRGARTAGRSRPQTRSAPALRARRRLERARSRQKRRTRQKPGRSPHRARAGPLARVVARAPTGVPARTGVTRQTPPRTRQEPAASAYRTLLRFSTITDPVRIRLRRPGIA